jgi:hypothetical protein
MLFYLQYLSDPTINWLREKDLNLRPSGYEPDELPDCSIPPLIFLILTYQSRCTGRYATVCKYSVPCGFRGYYITRCNDPDLLRLIFTICLKLNP